MGKTQTSRRRFLKKSAAAAGLVAAPPSLVLAGEPAAAGAAEPTRSMLDNNSLESVLYGRRSRFVTTTREVEGRSHYDTPRIRPEPYRPSARTPLGELTGTITPTSLHFTTQHYYGIPDINRPSTRCWSKGWWSGRSCSRWPSCGGCRSSRASTSWNASATGRTRGPTPSRGRTAGWRAANGPACRCRCC
jgi:hypothetical protein